jgi:ribonuclease HI
MHILKTFIDGDSNRRGFGVDLILESKEGLVVEVSIEVLFQTTNNQAEYETCIVGINLTIEMGARSLKLHTDYQLVWW